MKLRRRRRHRTFLGNALTPLLDILFLLLIFLMLAANFDERQVIEVTLPRVGGDMDSSEEASHWIVTLARDGTLKLDGVVHTTESLREHLQDRPREDRLRTLIIQGDEEANLGHGLGLLRMLEEIGYVHCTFQVQGIPAEE